MSNKADRNMGRTGRGKSCRMRTPPYERSRIPSAEEKKKALRALTARIAAMEKENRP